MNTKKFLSVLLLTLIIFTNICCAPSAEGNVPISIYIDGTPLECDVPPIIENDRTLVPIRAIAEAVGTKVSWDEATKKITLLKNSDSVVLYIGDQKALVNGTATTLDTAPKILNNRTLVPLRFVGECFGFSVGWENSTRAVTLTSLAENVLSVYILNVGQADSIFVRFPDNKTMLVDGGNSQDSTKIINFLKSQKVTKLDYLVATHPHADHIGGLPDIINKVGSAKYYMPNVSHNTATFENLLLAIKNKNGKITTAKAGVVITQGTFEGKMYSAEIVAPCKDSYDSLNNYSAVIMLSFGGRKILLTGDAENLSENQITADISADVLKVGHHGSSTSTGKTFLNRVKPQIAVISVGEGNSYGHPHTEVMTRLQDCGCKIYRTDKNGTVLVATDGTNISVTTDLSTFEAEESHPEADGNTKVYISKTGKKYHYRDCSGLSQSNNITEITLAQARSENRTPCKICNPPL